MDLSWLNLDAATLLCYVLKFIFFLFGLAMAVQLVLTFFRAFQGGFFRETAWILYACVSHVVAWVSDLFSSVFEACSSIFETIFFVAMMVEIIILGIKFLTAIFRGGIGMNNPYIWEILIPVFLTAIITEALVSYLSINVVNELRPLVACLCHL